MSDFPDLRSLSPAQKDALILELRTPLQYVTKTVVGNARARHPVGSTPEFQQQKLQQIPIHGSCQGPWQVHAIIERRQVLKCQYGPRAKALATHLNQHHLVPIACTCFHLRDIFGLALSQGSLQAFNQQSAERPWHLR
jgi:hypothetical protein